MTQEEKLEEAKRLYETANADQKYVLESLFPELAESEDERIRKEIISYIKSSGAVTNKQWVAWLEKQGEQSNANKEYWRGYREGKQEVLDKYSELKKQGEQKPIIEMKTPEESLGIDSETYSKIVDECIYGEQKPTDNVEPKFKVGDWIIDNNIKTPFQITGISNEKYDVISIYGNDMAFSFREVEHFYHLWTIQDAKDGNILVCGKEKRPFIFKGLLDKFHPDNPVAYCGIDCCNEFCITVGINWWTDEEVEPATKEKRDTLFTKIKEAGYEWDAEKKELKKIEQKPTAWTPMDEQRVENLLAIIEGHGYPGEVAWLNSLKDRVQSKQEWSREDSVRMDELCTFIQDYGDNFYCSSLKMIVINWLKSIKERVVPQQKQEWNEEDEKILFETIMELEYRSGLFTPQPQDYSKMINWLKSLRPKNTWKPSDEQMDSIKYSIDYLSRDTKTVRKYLMSLYEDLKKLKG